MSVANQNPNSPTATPHNTFEFPTLFSDSAAALQNDVVFCGRVIVRQTQRSKPVRWSSFRLPATGYSPLRRGGTRRRSTGGMFGVVKFPVQMELSDMKKRQSARLKKLSTAASDGESEEKGEKSGWRFQLIRMLRRKGRQWLNALSTSSYF